MQAAATSRTKAQLSSVRRQRALLAERKRGIDTNDEVGAGADVLRHTLGGVTARMGCTPGGRELHGQLAEGWGALHGDLLCMHQLLRGQAQEHERRADAESATCRRQLLLCAARERLQLLGLHSQGSPTLSRMHPPSDPGCTLAISLPHSRWVAVVSDRWSVVNPAQDKLYAAARASAVADAEVHSGTAALAEGYVSVPASCVERLLLAGVERSSAVHDTARALATGTFAGVSARQATFCANVVRQSPLVQLRTPPHRCLATCIRGATAAHDGGGQMEEGVGYALRCRVVMRRGELLHTNEVEMLGGDVQIATPGSNDGQVASADADMDMLAAAITPCELVVYVTHEEKLLHLTQMPSSTEVQGAPLAESINWLCGGIDRTAMAHHCQLVTGHVAAASEKDSLADLSARFDSRCRMVQKKLASAI